jgi:secreted Zn-dependent insulinase-like peptidase
VNIFMSSKEYKDIATKIEPIYNTTYIDEDISAEWRDSWLDISPLPEFYLPGPNKFIAQNLTLCRLLYLPRKPQNIQQK